MESESDRFAADLPIVLREDLTLVRFRLESENAEDHTARIRIKGLPAGNYTIGVGNRALDTAEVREGGESLIELPVNQGTRTTDSVQINRLESGFLLD